MKWSIGMIKTNKYGFPMLFCSGAFVFISKVFLLFPDVADRLLLLRDARVRREPPVGDGPPVMLQRVLSMYK